MGLIEELAATAGVFPVEHGSLALLSAADATRLVEAAGTRGVRVLGAEGFRVAGRVVEPDMDAILDLSELGEPVEAVAEATAFLQALSDEGLMFDVVIDDPGEAT